jgi:ubiquinone/menaquinone biosynthesis C-methylase UbiE
MKDRTKKNQLSFSEKWVNRSASLYRLDHHNKYINEILELIDYSDAGRILEVGCGNGKVIDKMKSKTKKDVSITGIDISYDLLKEAKKSDEHNEITYFQSDAEKLPFNDNSFDVVMSISVLWYMYNPIETFNEVLRVLKPGGQFLVDFQNRYHISYVLDDLSGIINCWRKNKIYKEEKLITRVSPLSVKRLLSRNDISGRIRGYYCVLPNYIPYLGDKGNFFKYFPYLNVGFSNSFLSMLCAKLVFIGEKL